MGLQGTKQTEQTSRLHSSQAARSRGVQAQAAGTREMQVIDMDFVNHPKI